MAIEKPDPEKIKIREFGETMPNSVDKSDNLKQMMMNIQLLINQLRELKLEERLVYDRRRVEDNYNSNAIEGSVVTLDETYMLLEGMLDEVKRTLLSKNEILDYSIAQDYMLECYMNGKELTRDLIVEMHRKVLQRSRPMFAGKVRYKGFEVSAGLFGFIYTKGKDVDEKLASLLGSWINRKSEGIVRTLYNIVEFKYKFLQIHPFGDGNGRTARLLMNFLLLSNKLFPLIVQANEKKEYIDSIKEAQKIKDVSPHFIFLMKIYYRELNEYVKYARSTFI